MDGRGKGQGVEMERATWGNGDVGGRHGGLAGGGEKERLKKNAR